MSAPKTKFLVLSSVNNNVIHLETISILTTAANAVLGLFLARLAVELREKWKQPIFNVHIKLYKSSFLIFFIKLVRCFHFWHGFIRESMASFIRR